MRLYPLKLHLKHDIFHCILLFIVDRFLFSFFFSPPYTTIIRHFSPFLIDRRTQILSRTIASISFEFPTKFYPVTFITRTFLPTCYISVSSSHNDPLYLTLIYPRCSFASPPSFSTASPIRSTVFTLLYYSILFRSSIFILLLIYLFYPFIYFSLPLPSLLCLFRCECTSDEGERASEERETRSRQERALSICSLTSPPRSNVRLFSVIIFLIIIATILFFVNVIVVLQHSLSPIFPCCRTRRRRKGDEFRST